MKPIPKWIQDLTINTLVEFSPDGDIPIIKVRQSQDRYSSGCCNAVTGAISLNLGTDRTDGKLVLLHELCHWMRPRISKAYGDGQYRKEFSVCEGHTDGFWDLVWKVYRWAGLPIRYCYKRESSYKVGAIKAYKRSIKKEA